METATLKKFARFARRSLIEQVAAKLSLALAEHSAARRENANAVKDLEKQIKDHGEEQVIEQVAYTWFNRFCALRFMDANRYTRMGVASPAPGQLQPEILAEAKMGHIDEEIVPQKIRRQKIRDLLDGKAPSRDPQGEAYRLLLTAACNYWQKAMPFLFERIADYTELLMPDDLLSANSILTHTREAMTEDICKDVEAIGWLYQFYISEKKDEVFAGLKKNQKITPENIPAATQLFTPHWIVRYLVENSLGRLWMLNRPHSKLAEQMDYYIRPEQEETDFLRVETPEEITVCDPACGSGHMLTYAFDLLYAIYEEEGYDPAEIPEKILTRNLYGMEIDKRAGQLAAFALTMKARARQRRFFEREIKPNICVLENIHFEGGKLNEYIKSAGADLFTLPLQRTLQQFKETNNFGSLIRPEFTDAMEALRIRQVLEENEKVEMVRVATDVLLQPTHEKILLALKQIAYLSRKYHVVITNPPYMGRRKMNGRLKDWLKDNYSDMKSDLFSAFVLCCAKLGKQMGGISIMSPNVWMYISTHEALRRFFIEEKTLLNLVELPLTGFKGATVQICAYNFQNALSSNFKGKYIRLVDFKGGDKEMAIYTKEAIKNLDCSWHYRISSINFKKIPGSPIAYWVSNQIFELFNQGIQLGEIIPVRQGLATADNNRFLRSWPEVNQNKCGYGFKNRNKAILSGKKWFPYNKGGEFRKWFGNNENLVNWEFDGKDIRSFGIEDKKRARSVIRNYNFYFLPSVTWSFISSSYFGVRYSNAGAIFDVGGSSVFPTEKEYLWVTGFLCSKQSHKFLKIINPTLNFQVGNVASLPVLKKNIYKHVEVINKIVKQLISCAKSDWDSYETSWDFSTLPLLDPHLIAPPPRLHPPLVTIYNTLRACWRDRTLEMQRLEEENNRIFIEAYGLQDELAPDVPLKEITLTCNPHYRYGGNKSEDELERLLLADTMRELVSYAVGCMFGRYALEKPGLILANQGETFADYAKQVPESSFPADDDNVIPMLDGNWFTDDIAERFRAFLRVAFGEKHYEDNLRFVEEALNIKGKRNYSIRSYFLSEFYKDHVKRYKKRPIYWLFSSPRGSFNALIYMHRYRPDTVSVVLNDYLREFRAKLASRKEHLETVSISESSSRSEKTSALKEIEKISRMITEMEEYERDALYPLATRQVEIDLDDGVKVNYPKLGPALKKISGLSA